MLASALPHSIAGGPYTWAWDASILIGIALWTLAYLLVTGPLQKRGGWEPASRGQKIMFSSGTLVLFLALVSPLDHLSDEYLFTAHMIQHLLLLMVIPPLWLMGLPKGFIDGVIRSNQARRIARWLVNPVAAYFIFNVLVYTWHFPSLYQAALENENIHIVEHLTFLAAAVVGWWPVLGPSTQAAPRASYPIQLIYLFLMMFPMTLLAALITFAKQPIYPFYTDAPRIWGLSVMADQQVAGLTMWIPGNMIFFIAFANAFFRWFDSQEHADRTPSVYPNPVTGLNEPDLARLASRKEPLNLKS